MQVFFPAVTGIMAGANISGDLRDPGKAIPRGTLLAVAITYLSYMAYAVMAAGCALRHAHGPQVALGGNDTKMESSANESVAAAQHHLDCATHRNCSFGLANSQQMMEVISAWSPLIYAGCFSATLSSAIAALEGAPRVLQALAKDNVFPGIVVFARGKGANKEPLWGYLLVSAIALACIFVGDLNVVSGLLSNFFAVTYAVVNFASFHAGLNAGTPGWRPSFACHSRLLSLAGTLLCVAIMLAMDYITAVATFLCLALFYAYVRYWSRPPSSGWGTSSQSHAFDAALGAVKRHGDVGEHVKNFRPRLAVLSGDPCQRPELIRFGSILASSAASFMVCVNVIDGGVMGVAGGHWLLARTSRASAEDWLRRNRIRAFAAATCSSSVSDGIRPALELVGLGGLTPNTVLMGFKSKWAESPDRGEEFYRVVRTALDMHFSLCVLRSAATLNNSSTLGQFYMTGHAEEQQGRSCKFRFALIFSKHNLLR
jgi:solute carrier family 12 sodium/potassium/chloride transporter 2